MSVEIAHHRPTSITSVSSLEARFSLQRALRFHVRMLPAQPHIGMRDAVFSALEMLDYGKLFMNAASKRTKRNWLIAIRWLLDMLITQWQELPRQGTHVIHEPLVGSPLAVHASKRG